MKRRDMLLAMAGAAAAPVAASAADNQRGGTAALPASKPFQIPPRGGFDVPLLFVQQDSVLSFPVTGDGVRVGTAVGRIAGTTIQNFQFLAVPPPDFAADDLMALTDTDGDQILFRAKVTGRFIPPFGDASLPSGVVFGVGGPFTGTYEVLKATGKYGYLVGRKFPCRGIGSNPAKGNFFGTVYVEVYSDRFDIE